MSEPTKQVSRVSAGSIKWTVGWITTDFVKKKRYNNCSGVSVSNLAYCINRVKVSHPGLFLSSSTNSALATPFVSLLCSS
jgi:hypothetical protein